MSSTTTLNISLLSSTAGENSDGVVLGTVDESLLDFIGSKRIDATSVKIFRRDVTPTGVTFTDLSTQGSEATIDDVEPFGATADMGSTDTFFISDTDSAVGIYVQVTTPGVWTGTGLKIFDSTDGITAGRELVNVVDPSDGFRNGADWYKITWDEPATPGVQFSPVPDDIPSRKYVMVSLDGFASVTTAPKIGRMVVSLATDGHKYNDVTSIANGSLVVAPVLPDYFPDVGEETIAHFSDPTYGFERYLFLERTAGIETVVAEYLRNDNTWQPLPDYVDPSNNAEAVPSTSPEKFSARWSIPDDWIAMPYSVTLTTDVIHSATAFWFRVRVTAVSAYGFIPSPLQRIRIKKFGASTTTGIVAPTSRSFTYLNVASIGALSGNTTVAQLTNMTSGRGSAFTIPAAPTLPLNFDITDISLNTGDKYAVQHISGAGNLTDVQLVIDYI